ncbi:aminotransferase class I/II-fold pyridoxal phosphate-dependent enzyme [Paracoccus sp. S-4012]|uniref:pyridoxal phosphate-dependent aminotransferase n=1 Tax=Paracoccus sp. S-4012 TaxID=2665648 RepID=UPI0012AFD717|nr:aminotransferase class I/II-fold pyridoxal phosphate-dependent enzyme [Paracoccus sp. S-4012]MRX50104.1 aminotransferase class I/II-fold pyridoxal phosphate-dependent enzyme [Paracoccus sp. S-4012]
MTIFARRITETSAKDFGMVGRAAARGGDLIHLELGRPVHDTPAHIKAATIAAIEAGHVHYSDLQGLPELREALAAKLARDNGINVGAEGILVTNGLTQASFAAIMALIDQGDEAILLEPYYPQHIGKIELAGGRVVSAPLDAAAGFRIRRDLIAPKITPRTKLIALINPCNPTGRVYSREELEELAALAIEHDLIVLSDEVYEEIVFDGNRHISIASLPGMAERTISCFAFTKAWAMDGWRVGYLAADPSMIPALMKITTNEVTHVNTFVQHGALAAVTGPREPMERMLEADRAARDLVVSRLNQLPGITCAAPEGTIYAFADITGTGMTARAAAEALMDEAGVVVEAGSFYGPTGEHHLRICFGAQPLDRLGEAMDRIGRFFNAR